MRDRMTQLLKGKALLAVLVIAAVAFVFGYFAGGNPEHAPDPAGQQAGNDAGKPTIWTCSMHPQIRLPKPGKCPICFMDLIPLKEDEGEGGSAEGDERRLTMSQSARKLAEIATVPVTIMSADHEVRMVGKVDYDETKVAYITAWMQGRLDRLYVDYTGVPVRKGDHLVSLYSPALISAQGELLQAARAIEELKNSRIKIMQETARRTLDASRDKLRLLGLRPEQIEEVERRGTPTDHVTIYSPIGGIVIHKNALEGMYVDTGTRIYTIADLSSVWVQLDAYESDLTWIRYGQEVEFTTEAYPGDTFRGTIAFIDPVVNEKTRTVRVRLNVPNPGQRLKPEMFVRSVLRARVTADGGVIDAQLQGKWICPMHPSVVRDRRGACDICGMDLVSAKELGYAGRGASPAPQLVIPASAPLITGKRAVVYVKVPGTQRPTYSGREVVLGPRTGDYYLVRSGLTEGEEVVVSGNFKIDSALQILAKPSMMSPEGGVPAPVHDHGSGAPTRSAPRDESTGSLPAQGTGPAAAGEKLKVPDAFRNALSPLYDAYFDLQDSLARDSLDGARKSFKTVGQKATDVDMSLVKEDAHMAWMTLSKTLLKVAQDGAGAPDLAKARDAFGPLALAMLELDQRFGHAGHESHYKAFCPMAFDNKGAPWLQRQREINNPFFGAMMLRCGEVQQTYPGSHGEE